MFLRLHSIRDSELQRREGDTGGRAQETCEATAGMPLHFFLNVYVSRALGHRCQCRQIYLKEVEERPVSLVRVRHKIHFVRHTEQMLAKDMLLPTLLFWPSL